MSIRSFSLPALVIACLLSVLATGLTAWLSFGVGSIRLEGRVDGLEDKIRTLVETVQKQTDAQGAFLARLEGLTARFDEYLRNQADRDR